MVDSSGRGRESPRPSGFQEETRGGTGVNPARLTPRAELGDIDLPIGDFAVVDPGLRRSEQIAKVLLRQFGLPGDCTELLGGDGDLVAVAVLGHGRCLAEKVNAG